MDIGCYAINVPRFIFSAEPIRVISNIEFDHQFNTDRIASGMLGFGENTATFTVGTQLSYFQRVDLIGTNGRIVVEIPFNPPPDEPARFWLINDSETKELLSPIANQYTLQGDAFSQAIIEDTSVPTPLEDAVANMAVIDALFLSQQRREWVSIKPESYP